MCYTQICPRFECRDEHTIHTCVYCVLTLNAGEGWGYGCGCVCVCVCICMSGYAFRHASRYQAESWHGVGDGPTRFVGIFSKRPNLGSKVILRSICLRNALWLPNLVLRTPDQSVVHCWVQRSCRGHLGSTRGQIA